MCEKPAFGARQDYTVGYDEAALVLNSSGLLSVLLPMAEDDYIAVPETLIKLVVLAKLWRESDEFNEYLQEENMFYLQHLRLFGMLQYLD